MRIARSFVPTLVSLVSVAVALACVATTAFGETTVMAPAVEAKTADNALRIGKGCALADGTQYAVLAQSVVIPTVSPAVALSDGTKLADLTSVITQGTLTGLAKSIQSTSIFYTQQSKLDALGNVIGWSYHDGDLLAPLGRTPFQFAAPNFVKASCVKRLLVTLAVADVCALGGAETLVPGSVNLWIPSNGSRYATAGLAAKVPGIALPPILIVNRDLVANPMSATCGAGLDATVTPSAADIDANLRIPGIWGLPPASGTADSVPVIEYYNASLDHYFITWVSDEIAKLDAGDVIKGWTRTGRIFRTYKTPQAGTSQVCRFYIPPALGDSHFFGRGAAECAATAQKNPSFVLEDNDFMNMYLPNAGVCPANTAPIYRVFSNRTDANHRYLTDTLTRNEMVTKGWLAEGDGPDLVVMCAPQ